MAVDTAFIANGTVAFGPAENGLSDQALASDGDGGLYWASMAHSSGLVGGQTIYGGKGSGEHLILVSTSHATKGLIALGTPGDSRMTIDGRGRAMFTSTTLGAGEPDAFVVSTSGADSNSAKKFRFVFNGSDVLYFSGPMGWVYSYPVSAAATWQAPVTFSGSGNHINGTLKIMSGGSVAFYVGQHLGNGINGRIAIGNAWSDSYLPGQLNVRTWSSQPTLPTAVFQAVVNQTSNLVEWRGSDNSVKAAIGPNGAFKPANLANSAAPNGSLYYSTDAGKLVYKDSAGVINPLY